MVFSDISGTTYARDVSHRLTSFSAVAAYLPVLVINNPGLSRVSGLELCFSSDAEGPRTRRRCLHVRNVFFFFDDLCRLNDEWLNADQQQGKTVNEMKGGNLLPRDCAALLSISRESSWEILPVVKLEDLLGIPHMHQASGLPSDWTDMANISIQYC